MSAVTRQRRVVRTGYILDKDETLDSAEVERRTICQCGEDSRPYEEEVDREFVVGRSDPVIQFERRCLTCGRTVR